MKENHVVLICDDNYCFPTIICIQSIILSCSCNVKYEIHVCSFGLSNENLKKLNGLTKDNIKIVVDIFKESSYVDKLQQVSQKTHVSPAALIKFELPNYFVDYDEMLYIDSDIIIKSNIDELFNINIENYYLAASYDFYTRLNKINYSFKRDYDDFYFNSGVMLLNLKKMRQDDVTSKLWFYKINKAKTRLMDQESLNAVCGHNTLPLSLIWNFNPVFLDDKYINEINHVYHESFSALEELEREVKIIHYVGKSDKPWIYKNAKLRIYWDFAFNSYNPICGLKLVDYPHLPVSTFLALKNKVELFGYSGLLCFFINKLLKRNL